MIFGKEDIKVFFFDTIDSYRLYTKTTTGLLTQQLGIINLTRAIKQEFSGVHLLFNRGFDILDEVSDLIDGIVAESLFTSWNPQASLYQTVPQSDYEWLLEKLFMVRDKYKLPITVIDYLPDNQQERRMEIARKIFDLQFTPWVSTMALNTMGVGTPDLTR